MMTHQIRIRSRRALLALAGLAWLAQSPAQAAAAPPIDGDLPASPASTAPSPAPVPAPAVPAPVQTSPPATTTIKPGDYTDDSFAPGPGTVVTNMQEEKRKQAAEERRKRDATNE